MTARIGSRTGQGPDTDPTPRRATGPLIVVASPDREICQRWATSLGGSVEPLSELSAVGQFLRTHRPSLLLIDLTLPQLDGARGIAGLVHFSPSTRIVALTPAPVDQEAVAVLLAGAHGYCSRDTEAPMVRKMVEAVQKGELWVKRSVMLALLRELIPSPRESDRETPSQGTDARLQPLTRREREIAYLVSAGAKNKDIAASLNITETTVKAHLTAIFRKLGIPDRLRLALMITEGDRLEQERAGRARSRS